MIQETMDGDKLEHIYKNGQSDFVRKITHFQDYSLPRLGIFL